MEDEFQAGVDDLQNKMGWMDQINSLTAKGRAAMRMVDKYVRTLQATLNQIANPANSLTAMINYGTNLPGVVMESLAKCVERYSILYNTAANAPDRFMTSLTVGLAELTAASGTTFGVYTTIHTAQRCALELSYILKADKENLLAQKQAGAIKSFDGTGRYVASPYMGDQPMTMDSIEGTLALVRAQIQAGVDVARDMQSLKNMAQILDDHVAQVKKDRPKVVAVDVALPTPLHLICLKYGMSYQAAEQLMTINKIKNPSFTSGTVDVYAR
jgi:hypothetical protein